MGAVIERDDKGKFVIGHRSWNKGNRLPNRPTKEELERLYYTEKTNTPKIGELLGVNKTTVLDWMKEYNIPRRSQGESLSSTVKKLWKNPEYRAKLMEHLKDYWSRSEERSYNTRQLWCNPTWRAKVISNRVKSFLKRPTNPEKRVIEVIKRERLPFRYCGNGSFLIGRLNPDFVSTNKLKKVIEVFGRVFHDPDRTFKDDIPWFQQYWGRMTYYAEFGYDCLIIWDDQLDDEKTVARIRRFTECR